MSKLLLDLMFDLIGIIRQATSGSLTAEEANAAAHSRIVLAGQQLEALPTSQADDYDVLR